MTIVETLSSLTTYPIPDNAILAICINRGLESTTVFTLAVSELEAFQLAIADVYMWMYSAPSLSEQEVSVSVVERSTFKNKANIIYGKYDAPEFTGITYGFTGENFNDL